MPHRAQSEIALMPAAAAQPFFAYQTLYFVWLQMSEAWLVSADHALQSFDIIAGACGGIGGSY